MDPVATLRAHTSKNFDDNDIRQGAFVVLKDSGRLYRELASKGRERWSNHPSLDPTVEVVAVRGVVLIGRTQQEGHTWLQWERSMCCSFTHCIDWLIYKYTRKNQGPYGTSKHTQSHGPLEII